MLIKRGIPVSPGIAICKAIVLDAEDQPVPRRTVAADMVETEQQRLSDALHASFAELEKLREQTAARHGSELAKIFAFHLGMLADKHLIDQIRQTIERDHVTAEFSVYSSMRDLAQNFRKLDSRVFRDRAADIWDLEQRILSHLIGTTRKELSHLTHEAVVVAYDLTPSQTAALDKQNVRGLATDAGGRTSHTAILAHALGIPAIVGVEGLSAAVSTGDTVIVDGNNGVVVINPDAAKLLEYRQQVRKYIEAEHRLIELRDLPAVTTDGTGVELLANIEFPSEIAAALDRGATGIGLYRTEFLFLASASEPSEEQQYETYVEAVRALAGRPMTIRTLDLGADKVHQSLTVQHQERNPFLGCRSIRLCLQNLPMFKSQLRAILRASAEGPVSIMFPMVSNIMELRQSKMILSDVMEDLDDQRIPYRRDIPVGIMIEVPSAALQAAALARESDFFSIGTNDLIQYTVAVDRSNERIASLYSAAHPAVLMLIRQVIEAAGNARIPVSICGEMAGEPEYTMLLLGMGLRTFSMTPPAIPELKRIVRAVSLQQCQQVANWAQSFDSDRGVLNFLRHEVRKVVPEVFDSRSLGA